MKTWKLISGILSIVLFVIVALQSCAAGVIDTMSSNSGTSGAAGILVAIDLLAGGIVSTATRNSSSKGSDIAMIILFGLGTLIGFTMHGIYSDLIIWSFWCLINVITSILSLHQKG